MSRGACTFRQRDVAAALRAARDAGVDIAKVEIDKNGTITLVYGKPSETVPVVPVDDQQQWEKF
jgi:glutaredoxin